MQHMISNIFITLRIFKRKNIFPVMLKRVMKGQYFERMVSTEETVMAIPGASSSTKCTRFATNDP